MKTLTILFLLYTFSANAAQLKIVGPCSEIPSLQKEEQLGSSLSVGAFTLQVLKKYQVPFEGTESNINAIQKSPQGKDAFDYISPTFYRVYGWCYTLDGVEVQKTPDQVRISNSSRVSWTYSFSTYKDGQWLEMCAPSWKLKSKKICP